MREIRLLSLFMVKLSNMVSSDAHNLCYPHSQLNQKPSIKSVECSINYCRLTIAIENIFFKDIPYKLFGYIPADQHFE